MEEENEDINTGYSGRTFIVAAPVASRLELALFADAASGNNNSPVRLKTVIKNTGTGSTGGFYLNYSFSKDSRVSSDDLHLWSVFVDGVTPDGTIVKETIIKIPSISATPPGDYHVLLVAKEVDASFDFRVTAPDLIISVANPPATASFGDQFFLEYSISNRGDGSASIEPPDVYPSLNKEVVNRLYVSTDPVFDETDVVLGWSIHGEIPAGATLNQTFFVRVPEVPLGQYYVIAVADILGGVKESDETNNVFVSSSKIELFIPPINLVTLSVDGSASATVGNVYLIDFRVRNDGTLSTRQGFYTVFYLSLDNVLDFKVDTWIGDKWLDIILPGDEVASTASISIPFGLATGDYYLIGVADGYRWIPETNEADNIGYDPIPVGVNTGGGSSGGSPVPCSPSGCG